MPPASPLISSSGGEFVFTSHSISRLLIHRPQSPRQAWCKGLGLVKSSNLPHKFKLALDPQDFPKARPSSRLRSPSFPISRVSRHAQTTTTTAGLFSILPLLHDDNGHFSSPSASSLTPRCRIICWTEPRSERWSDWSSGSVHSFFQSWETFPSGLPRRYLDPPSPTASPLRPLRTMLCRVKVHSTRRN